MSMIWKKMLVVSLGVAATATLSTAGLTAGATPWSPDDDADGWSRGELKLESVASITFGPDGILFVADPKAAAVIAIDTEDGNKGPGGKAGGRPDVAVAELDEILAYITGTTANQIRIHDLAVNPASGKAFLSITRGRGSSAQPAIVRIDGPEKLVVLDLTKARFQRSELMNAPAPDDGGRRSRRTMSITDLEYHSGQLYVAGLSNEEFASKLRVLDFPFAKAENAGTSVEIYHAAHGAWETRSPVRTLIPMNIGGDPYILCGYTCTPLVRFPVSELLGDRKLVGTTVAELGNRNTPLDMVVYERDSQEYVLIANTSRGVMKVSTKGILEMEGLTERVSGTSGLTYETIEGLSDVTQLAALDETRALILVEPEDGPAELRIIDLP